MAGQPLSAAELEKVKNYLLNGAAKSNTGSVIPYSPEYIDKLAAMSKAPVRSKPKASKGLLAAKEAPIPTGLLTSPESEFTQDSAAPVTQEFLSAANKGVAPAPSAVATVPNDPNIAASWAKPKISKEVVTTTKPDGTKIEKAKHTEEAPKSPKTNTVANGDFIPADAMPKTNHNMPPKNVSGATVGPSISQDPTPQLIPGTMNYEAPNVNRFDPTAPPVPIVAQYPMAMPPINPDEIQNTGDMIPAEKTVTQGLDTKIAALAPLPQDIQDRFNQVRDQRLSQVADNEQASKDFMSSYEPRTDMSALLSFIGSQLGRDYLAGYKKPAGLGDLVGIQDKLEENIAKAKTGLSDSDLQYLKARMQLQDTQKSSEEMKNLMKSLQLAALKGSSTGGLAEQKYQTQLSEAEQKAGERFATRPEFSDTLEGHNKIFGASANLNKILFNNGGAAPLPRTTEARKLNQAMAELIYLVNKYDAGLGALAAADSDYLKGALGFGTDKSKIFEYLESNYNKGLVEAAKVFQDKIRDSSRAKVELTRKVFSIYPSVVGMIDDVDDRIKSSIEDMELSRLGMAKDQAKPKIESDIKKYSPEEQKRILEIQKKIKGGK